MTFAYSCFAIPGQRGGQRHLSSLASKVNRVSPSSSLRAIASFPVSSTSDPAVQQKQKPVKIKTRLSSGSNLAARVSGKLEEGDIRGAIRMASSDETIAPFDGVTAAALRVKHPARASSNSMTPTPKSDSCLCNKLTSWWLSSGLCQGPLVVWMACVLST